MCGDTIFADVLVLMLTRCVISPIHRIKKQGNIVDQGEMVTSDFEIFNNLSLPSLYA